MPAVTQRIDNYLGGVSRQSDDKKLPGQVRECLNGYPDPTFGLTKRPGFKWISNLGSGTTFDDSKWFFIARTADEKYIGCIKPATLPTLSITGNGTSGATDKHNLATTTSGSGSGMTLNLYASGGVVTGVTINLPGTGYANNDTVTVASGVAGTGSNVTVSLSGTTTLGGINIWNALDGTACSVAMDTATSVDAVEYLSGKRTNYDVLTVQDTSILTNNLISVDKIADPTFIEKTRATLVVSGAVLTGDVYSVTIGSQTTTYTAQVNDGYDEVINGLDSAINSNITLSGLTRTKYQTTLELSRVVSGTRTAFSITAKGGEDNSKLTVFQDQVDNVSQLPTQSFQGKVVKVINTASTLDTYFAKFVADNGTSGTGFWQETLDPSKSTGLNAATMPHKLINTALNTFEFKQATWVARAVGDDTTNSHPSFVGYPIQQSFFHSNRLGFLSRDNVALSQSKDFYNLYHTSAQTVTDADPVDLSCATIRPAALHAVIPTTQGLVLFAKNQQFLMFAADGILTPGTTSIRTISNYEMDTEVDPVDVGTNINFISKTPAYTRIFGMVTRGQDENPQVLDVGRVVNEWVPATVDTFIASPQNQFLAMSSQSDDKIYFYRTYSDGEKTLVQSWFNWQLPGNVQSIAVDSDDFFAVTKQGTQFTLSKASLSQSPTDAIIVNNKGQRINPCMDLYTPARNAANNNKVDYDTTNDFSKCYIPWDNITALTPVIVIKGTTATGQFIESGFSTTPEVITNDGDPYFKVPKKDLTSVEDDVIVGWKYDFDVTLPKTYYRVDDKQSRTDFTSTLTISRMKFAVGLSGVMGFKVKSTGVRQGSRTFTGYDLTDANPADFKWIKDDISYVDRDQIKVKVNGIETTAFTFVNDTTIRLDSYPNNTLTAAANQHTFTWTFDRPDTSKIRVLLETAANNNIYTTTIVGVDYVISGKNVIFINNSGVPTAVGTGKRVKIYSADEIVVYLDEWYNLSPTQQADTYLANDIALSEQSVFTLPIHQKTDNFQVRLFNDSPFPVALNSMMWEGNYSPRFYRRK